MTCWFVFGVLIYNTFETSSHYRFKPWPWVIIVNWIAKFHKKEASWEDWLALYIENTNTESSNIIKLVSGVSRTTTQIANAVIDGLPALLQSRKMIIHINLSIVYNNYLSFWEILLRNHIMVWCIDGLALLNTIALLRCCQGFEVLMDLHVIRNHDWSSYLYRTMRQ